MNLKINETILSLWLKAFANKTSERNPFFLVGEWFRWVWSTRRHSAGIWDKEIELARSGFSTIYDGTVKLPGQNGTVGVKEDLGYGPRLDRSRQAGKNCLHYIIWEIIHNAFQNSFKVNCSSINNSGKDFSLNLIIMDPCIYISVSWVVEF